MIQQMFNMMFTLFMSKVMLNDIPHYLFEEVTMRTLRVRRVEEEYATPAQLRRIAMLSARLKIPEPVVKYEGEAGLMIRHLEEEVEGRKRLKGRNPTEEWSVDSLNSLENSLRSDPRSQKPGAIERAKERILAGHVDPIILDYESGRYIIRDGRHRLEAYTQLGYQKVPVEVHGENPVPTGTCYPDAWRFLMREGGTLVHGSVQLSKGGPRVKHAWVLTPGGRMFEPQTKQWFTPDDFRRLFSPETDATYIPEEASIMLARVGKHGPWSEEERRRWLKGGNPSPLIRDSAKPAPVVWLLISYKRGIRLGNVWEQSASKEECLAVAKDVFELSDGQVNTLASTGRLDLGPNLYETDWLELTVEKYGNPGPYEELPKYAPGPSYQDRQLTPQELKELKLDVLIERRTIDAIEKLYNHFVYERKNRPWNYNDEQIRTGLTNIYFWLVKDAGESGIGSLNVMHKVILVKIDEEVVHKDIYRDFLAHFHYMKDRWLESLLTGKEVDLS